MKRTTVQFKKEYEGSTTRYVSIKADYFAFQEGDILTLWDGDTIVGFFRLANVDACYITEQKDKETNNG